MTGDLRDDADDHFWVDGEMLFRVAGAGAEPERLVKVGRPFAIVGRAEDADLVIPDRAASTRHTYFHLDPRGVYAVDLVTRTGTLINGSSRMVGWLRPGDWIEVAGRRIELVRLRIDGAVVEPPLCEADLLADGGLDALAAVTLEPSRLNDSPWVLSSELVFLGWSAACGIQIKDQAVARTHCALVRTHAGAYLVNLCGRRMWVEDREVYGAAALCDGDVITIGSTQFCVRVDLPVRPPSPELLSRQAGAGVLARISGFVEGRALSPYQAPGLPMSASSLPSDAPGALLAWIMGAIQGGQGEMLRRQGEFQLAMTEALRQIQQDNAQLLNAHLDRIEGIDRELAALRAEIARRQAGPPPPPHATPLRITRPSNLQPEGNPSEATGSTAWLLDRVSQLEDENRSAWKDILGRINPSKKAT
jgi:pSer/pThr/pTyr-binding forkhead associated (FHA) protein